MNLETKILFNDIIIVKSEDNSSKIISKSVKLTNKNKQRVQNKREFLEDNFLKIAQIDRKKSKKTEFFNKHKNQ